MAEIKLNPNEYVRFKPTEYGMDIFYHQFDGIIQLYPQISIKPHFPELDADGHMKMQLWCFMELYGPHMHLGSPAIIENNDIFYEAKRDDKHREASPWQ